MKKISTKLKSSKHTFADTTPYSSPIIIRPRISWNEREIKVINWLKRRYKFDTNFDLAQNLARMNEDHPCFSQLLASTNACYTKQSWRLNTTQEITHDLNLLKKHMINASAILKPILKKFTPEKKTALADLLYVLSDLSLNKGDLIRNSASGFKFLEEILNSLDLLTQQDILEKLLENIENEMSDLRIPDAKPIKSKAKPGRKRSRAESDLIFQILITYREGTKRKLICNYHPISGGYSGDFYYFLLATLSLLETKMPINKLKPGTWGQYAKNEINWLKVLSQKIK